MDLPKDPVMLLSVINMKLRDYYKSLEELCEDLNVSREDIEKTLNAIDYQYVPEVNQFK